ncbi:MAG TPA: hypothetical protein VK843_21380 [Planctomycetota bacterium]|nr:hypothetical protein [Planctomycetota bacterium]
MRSSSMVVCIVCLALSACATNHAAKSDYVIRGSIVDAETGAPIAHKDLHIDAFDDAQQWWKSPEAGDEATFNLRLPQSDAWLVVRDFTNRYQLYQTKIAVPPPGLDFVVRLEPTHFVVLKGRMLVEKDGAWVAAPASVRASEVKPVLRGGPLLSLHWMQGGSNVIDVRPDGSFEVRVPRARVEAMVVATPLTTEPRYLDLTGETADVIERDIHLVRPR